MLVGVAACSDASTLLKSSSLASSSASLQQPTRLHANPTSAVPLSAPHVLDQTRFYLVLTAFTDIAASPTFPLLHACHATLYAMTYVQELTALGSAGVWAKEKDTGQQHAHTKY